MTADAAELIFDGHYRSRAQFFNSLSLSDTNPNAEGGAAYIDHRLRLQPGWLMSDKVGLFAQLDLLPYVLWGDEVVQRTDPSLSALGFDDPILGPAVQPPTTEEGGATLQNLQVTRAWAELQTGIGQFRFGRMPLEWGAGMVFNAGNQPWQEFGDTVDRLQYTGRAGPIYLMAAFETDAENYVNNRDDVWGAAGSVLYAAEQASVGGYAQYRRYDFDESTFGQMTLDVWGEATAGPLQLETEVAANIGRGDLSDGVDDVSIASVGAIIEAQMDLDKVRISLGAGIATGDGDTTDKQYRTFVFDPDFNQTLFLFEEPMPTLAPTVQTDANAGRDLSAARTGYSLSNAMYARPGVGYQILDDLRADARFFIAQAAKLPDSEDGNRGYGSELDLRVVYTPMAHFTLDGTFGVFFPGSYYSNYTDDELGGGFDRAAVGAQILGTVQF